MNVELTPRSAALIAREQSTRGAISPEQLIEQALEAYVNDSGWHAQSTEDLRKHMEEAWIDAEQNGSIPAEKAWQEIHRALKIG